MFVNNGNNTIILQLNESFESATLIIKPKAKLHTIPNTKTNPVKDPNSPLFSKGVSSLAIQYNNL